MHQIIIFCTWVKIHTMDTRLRTAFVSVSTSCASLNIYWYQNVYCVNLPLDQIQWIFFFQQCIASPLVVGIHSMILFRFNWYDGRSRYMIKNCFVFLDLRIIVQLNIWMLNSLVRSKILITWKIDHSVSQ